MTDLPTDLDFEIEVEMEAPTIVVEGGDIGDGDIDGGTWSTSYGGTEPVDGGTWNSVFDPDPIDGGSL